MDSNYIESSNIPYYFPEVMRENPDYKVLIDLASLSFGKLESEIDDFNSLIDPDTCSDLFLPLLGSLLGYNYRYDIKPEFNREIIKNILSAYAMRGTDRSLILAATYGDCPGYIGGEIFIPGTKPERVEAYLEYPRDHIFKHTISSYSNSDRRADGNLYREGVIEVVVERFNDQIRDRVESVKPAGYVLRFKHLVWIRPENTNHIKLTPDIFLDIMFMVNSRIFRTNHLWSREGSRSNDFRYSGDRFYNADILRMIDLHQVDGRRYFTDYSNPVWMYYNPDSSLFNKPTDLQLPVVTTQSSTDHCVTACQVIYGHTENSSFDNDMNINTIESFSRKYVVTEIEVTISKE